MIGPYLVALFVIGFITILSSVSPIRRLGSSLDRTANLGSLPTHEPMTTDRATNPSGFTGRPRMHARELQGADNVKRAPSSPPLGFRGSLKESAPWGVPSALVQAQANEWSAVMAKEYTGSTMNDVLDAQEQEEFDRKRREEKAAKKKEKAEKKAAKKKAKEEEKARKKVEKARKKEEKELRKKLREEDKRRKEEKKKAAEAAEKARDEQSDA